MNDAHLHLVVNHFPIIGTIFGLGILITGLLLKNNSVKNIAYSLLVVAAVFAALSMGTGEGAEEMVEDLPSVGKQIIHEHEELAEKFALVLYATGALALIALFLSYKKNSLEKYVALATVGLALVAVVLAKEVGTSGGEIRHTEIRNEASQPVGAESQEQGEDND
jgi:uncharacterized membrane protein